MTNLPSPIDRAAIERIIQRATELQTGERDIADGLSPEEVLALGKEVGIPDRFLRQALLEEQGKANLPAPTGLLDRTLGPGVVSAQRVVQGDVDGLELTLLRWMESEELVEVQRQQPGRITWEPLRPGRATLRRLTSRRPFMLSHASLVAATITSLEPGFCHVSMSADIRPARGSMIIGMSVAGSVGVAGSAILGAMSPFLLLTIAPLTLGAGIVWILSRRHRPVAERTLLGLERAMDHLERGSVKPGHVLPPRAGGLATVLDEVRRVLGA
jgi:hypothetical protein